MQHRSEGEDLATLSIAAMQIRNTAAGVHKSRSALQACQLQSLDANEPQHSDGSEQVAAGDV